MHNVTYAKMMRNAVNVLFLPLSCGQNESRLNSMIKAHFKKLEKKFFFFVFF